ncbi:MAG TPA: alpha-hydroxy acid oxidase [Usitatibacter sp.]|nr:alpha-hydroxy acid oxidase [Usitatibacter sp.]
MSDRLRHILSLDDFERAARSRLPGPIFAYVSGAAETDASFRDNRAAFAEWGFVPRILVDVSKRTTAATLLGREWKAPFGIAPMGITALSAYRGDLVLARAAAAAGIPFALSASSLIRMEDVVRENPEAWFQAYLPGNLERIGPLIDRVAAAGFETLVVTVDVAVLPSRENNVRAGFSTPLRPSLRLAWQGVTHPRWAVGTWWRTILAHGMPHFENSFAERGAPIVSRTVERDFTQRDHLNWTHLEQIRARWKGKLVLKGIVSVEDARRADETGVDAIIVSNHGGRQLDGTVSPLRVLPQIVAAVRGMPVMVDGGFRRGTDVIKAFALGAAFAWIGRPFNFAAAVAGEEGVAHAAALLRGEIDRDMALLGVTSLAQVGPQHLMRMGGMHGR